MIKRSTASLTALLGLVLFAAHANAQTIISSLTPNTAPPGSPDLSMVITGQNIFYYLTVNWTFQNVTTQLEVINSSSNSITVDVPPSLLTTPGTATVQLVGSQVPSNTAIFTIGSPAPTLTSISPNSAIAGGPSFTLTAFGSGFSSSTAITWNGTSLPTSFATSGQITTTISSTMIATPGMASVGVTTPGVPSPTPLPFSITAPVVTTPLTLSSISPNSAVAGGPTFTITANGGGFTSGTFVTWNGSSLTTTFVSAGQLTANVPAILIATAGSASVGVVARGQTSPAPLNFVISQPFSLTNLSPSSAVAGGPSFTLAINGNGFTSQTVAYWNGQALATSVQSATQMTATVPSGLIATVGSASITAQNNTQVSNGLTFQITQPALTLSSISPNTAVAGGPSFTLTAAGSGFTANTVINWSGVPLATTFISGSQVNATVPANLIANVGSFSVVAVNGRQSSNGQTFTVTQAALTLTTISPNSGVAGGPSFTLTAAGTGFTANTIVTWNGTALATTFVSTSQLTAAVPANLIATQGTASVAANNSGVASNALPFSIAGLTLTSVSPSSVSVGGPSFTLTVGGTGFTPNTVITWNGSSLATTFVSANQLSATVPANLIATAGTASIDVASPNQSAPPGLAVQITSPRLSITTVTPGSAAAGGPAFTLLVNGTAFTGSTTVFWNTTALTTTFLNSTQVTAAVPANLLSQPGSASITAHDGTQVSNAVAFNISAGTLTLTSISPNSVIAGGPAFTLMAIGGGFTTNTVITWNGASLNTTFVSTTQLSAAVPASLIATVGTASVGVSAPNQATPAPLPFSIISFGLTSLSPASAVAGGPAFTLTALGAGFTNGTILLWNGAALATTFVSATQLTAPVGANLILQPGSASVTASNGSQVSNTLKFNITATGAVITSISPASVTVGGPAFTLTVNGTGFLPGAAVSLNGSTLATTFLSGTQVTAAVPAALIAQPGSAQITLSNPSSTASNAVVLTIVATVPVITSLSPASTPAGSAAFSMTVTGTGFLPGATVFWNGANLNTSFISGTQVVAAVTADLIVQPATVPITASNTGTAQSNAVNFTVMPPVPTITSISPSSVAAGGPAFTLTVVGTKFFSGATVSLNGTPLATTFVSGTQLTAAVPANLIAQGGIAPITAANNGGAASNAVSLTITSAAPTITSISPTSAPIGGGGFTLTVNGTNFLPGATVSLGPVALTTTFVSSTQLTATVPPNLVPQPGPLPVTVTNPGSPPSNTLTLTVTPPPPTLTSIIPVSAKVGDPTFTLSLTGTGFIQGSVAQWNGTPLNTTFVSSTQLTATIDAGQLVLPATASVTVANPVPNGSPLVSNALTFTINPVTPSISSISPNSANAGDPALSLTVNGTGFLTLTNIQWNGAVLTTHFVSATQVTADVPATLLAQAGSATVTAVNPGNNVSGTVTFTINPGTPGVIGNLSKISATAGDASFTLTVNGTSFRAGAVVNFGSNALATTFVSATQLTAVVTANLLLLPNTFQVVVQQSGTTSNAVSFVVNLPAPPALRLVPPSNPAPGQQTTIDFGLNNPYPILLSGTVTVTFVSNATVPVDDPMIQLSTGGRTLAFTLPANTTTLPVLQLQTGTVAGTITIAVTLTAAGVNVTPSGSSATIVIAKSAPVMLAGKVNLIRAAGYVEVDVTGFSTTRDMTQAVFHLNAAPNGSFTSTDITVPLSALFTTWYQSSASAAFGSQFTYAQPFTVVGDINQIQSVTVTLTNSAGTSASMTSN